ncbi:hypothetical protein ACIRPK_16675 [Kitasatospora sp. NPDC101801]|uniref:DUF7927 domain-containing protein n=1 Tax=Kitasatospora sp. NPDC101801 TaxID=3364103 RepID=UPI0037FAFC99
MQIRRASAVAGSLLTVAALLAAAPAPAAERVPSVRGTGTQRPIGPDPAFTVLTHGNLTMASNSVLACDDSQGDVCNDNSYNNGRTKWVKSDPAAPGNTASAATLTLPAGSTVRSARLYWQLNPDGTSVTSTSGDAGKADQVELKVPGASGYQRLTADTYDWFDQQTGGTPPKPITAHAGVKDVTALVQAAGSGSYTVADLQACQGRSSTADFGGQNVGCWGGWSLVVAYENPAEPLRYLQVWDGYQLVRPPNSTTTLTLTGIRTPAGRAPAATLGVGVGDGDTPIAGDSLDVGADVGSLQKLPMPTPGGTVVGDNAFTGRIDRVAADGTGTNLTDRDPSPVNNLGYDARMIDVTGKIPAGSSRAVLRITGEGDALHPQFVWLALEAVEPDLQIVKANTPPGRTDDNPPGNVEAGGEITYTFTLTNARKDGTSNDLDTATAVTLTDTLPTGTAFVAGSGPACSAAGQLVTCTAADLAAGASATLAFRAVVDPSTAVGTKLDDTARLSFAGQQTGRTQQRTSNTVRNTVLAAPAYRIVKTADRTEAGPGDRVGYRLEITNTGTVPIGSLEVRDDLVGLLDDASFNSDETAGTGHAGYRPTVLSWTGDLAPGQQAVVTYSVTVSTGGTGNHNLRNTVTADRTGGNCLPGSTDPACVVVVPVIEPSPTPSPTPSPDPSPTTDPAASPSATVRPDGGRDGHLPDTGATTLLGALFAVAGLGLGVLSVVASRRRRH